MDAPFGAWGTQTFIAGLTQDNLIAPWVIKGAMDGEAFETYVSNVLAPQLRPGRVSDLLCMSDLAHASELKEHDDNDDFQGITGRATERR